MVSLLLSSSPTKLVYAVISYVCPTVPRLAVAANVYSMEAPVDIGPATTSFTGSPPSIM